MLVSLSKKLFRSPEETYTVKRTVGKREKRAVDVKSINAAGQVISAEDDMLRVARPGIWAYENGPNLNQFKDSTWKSLEARYCKKYDDEENCSSFEEKRESRRNRPEEVIEYSIPPYSSRRRRDGPSPERDYMKTVRASRQRDYELEELEYEISQLRF